SGTVGKYVRELEDKLLISTEPTTITTKTGEAGKGNLMYTIEPIYKAMDNYYREQLRDATEKYNIAMAQKKLEEYDRKHPRASA
ncbi:MAG: helix-turn-helix domain-containing protein, partial [Clostridia bacterium]|nr:helix-turn-helix domain-containing protein [Clostridia bacterium]